MKNMLLIILVFSLFLLGCTPTIENQTNKIGDIVNPNIPTETDDEAELRYCQEDKDCVMVKTNCCASANCGYTGINKNYYDSWNAQFNCTDIACIAVVCQISFEIKCVNNQCTQVDIS